MSIQLNENAIGLLKSNVLVDTATGGEVILYTPSTGKGAVVTHLVVRDASLTLAAATSITFGTNTGTRNNWGTSTARTLLPVSTALLALPLYPTLPGDNLNQVITAVPVGGNFGVKFGTGTSNGATATFDVFGYEF